MVAFLPATLESGKGKENKGDPGNKEVDVLPLKAEPSLRSSVAPTF